MWCRGEPQRRRAGASSRRVIAFAAGISEHPQTAVAAGEALGQVSDALEGERPDLVIAFFTPQHLPQARNIATSVHEFLAPKAVIGGSVSGVIGNGRSVEAGPGISIWAARLDSIRVTTMLLETIDSPEGGEVRGWPDEGCGAGTLILMADPFSFSLNRFLASLNSNLPEVAVTGGFVSAGVAPDVNRLIADLSTTGRGAVGVLIEPSPVVTTLVIEASQPVGRAFTVTRAEGMTIYELGGKPALERLEETFNEINVEAKRLMSAALQLGIVLDEQQDEFGPGDFIVSDITGAERSGNSITTGTIVEVGQTVQFHVRDPETTASKLFETLSGVRHPSSALIFAPMGAEISEEVLAGSGRAAKGSGARDAAEAGYRPSVAGVYCAGQVGNSARGNWVYPDAVTLATFGLLSDP